MTPGRGTGTEREQGHGDFRRGLLAGALLAVLALALIAPLRDALFGSDPEAERVDEALEIIDRSYFRETARDDLENASVSGIVRELRGEHEDRFSHYFDPEAYDLFQTATSGEFSGVGLTVTEVRRGLQVARVFEGTPADDAGLAVGDVITAVDGRSIAGVASEEASARIKGEPGTEVELTVLDEATRRPREISVERAEIRVPAVEVEARQVGGSEIAYVILAAFSSGAHGELRGDLEELYAEGADGVVLDLRGNGGGLLQEAVLVTSLFLEDGPVVTTEGRTRPSRTLDAQGDALPDMPMAVLTNEGTASSSEIVTAALKQNDLATVVGTSTFGKGTFQEVIELEGGGALDLTVGEYLTSDGTSIDGSGVKPDVRAVDRDAADGDDVLRRGLRVVARQIDEES